VPRDPTLARHTAQVIDMLSEKTRGNLDSEEQRLLEALQAELRRAVGGAGG
jgi:hypothetical protein